ncbi:MAG: hypothetical protein IJT21_04780 [Synergistaceae bacterium]|nr:hypothetical protein [Synergistaceae bacterium]
MADKRDKNGRFLPGNDGGGRPKIPDDIKEAFKAATPAAVQKIISLMDCGNVKVELQAAQEILNRSLGKPETSGRLELSGTNDEAIIFKWINEQPNTQTITK